MSTKVVSKNARSLNGYEIGSNIPAEGQVLVFTSGKYLPTTFSTSSIYTANGTITDDARTVTLKSGGTATQNLQFLNSGGGNLLKLSGNKAIDFGSGTHTINPKFYLDGDIYQYFSIYNKTNANSICDIFAGAFYGNGVFYLKNSLGASNISMNAGVGATPQMAIMSLAGQYSRYRVYNSAGSMIVNLGASNSDKGDLELYNSSGNIKVNITTGYSVFDALMKIGGSFDIAIAQLQVVGSGSTSATTTALFQNSSSAKSLEILDSGAINIYNSGNFRIGYLNVYGGGVFGGNNNGGIGNDPNNVLGGSYLNGIILGGYNNTHNGYQGVIGGGFNTVTTNGTWNFVFSVGSTASAVAASVFGGSGHTASGAYSAVLGGESNTASGIGAVAIGGNQASASGYRSFAQGYGASATSDYAVVMGSYCSAVARSARAVGEYCVAAGVSSWVSGLGTLYGGTGKDLRASGLVSFNHSFNDGTVLYRAAEGNYSAILGGTNHWTKSGSTSSAILGGEGNTINASVVRSVILGGSAITATASDTAYAININASTLITTPQVITTPATITVTANAGTVTRANRINNFTNSSAATMTITMSTTAALDGDLAQVRIYDFSAATQTITWVNTENSSITVPATSNGSTTLPLTVGFQYNSATSKWRCIGSV